MTMMTTSTWAFWFAPPPMTSTLTVTLNLFFFAGSSKSNSWVGSLNVQSYRSAPPTVI